MEVVKEIRMMLEIETNERSIVKEWVVVSVSNSA